MSVNIQASQQEYLFLIKRYEELVFSDTINQKQIAMIIDDIQCFWLDRKDILKYELQILTSQQECCMLSGVIYLDIKDNEHYIFKALGQEHIISDPLLKLENFFRLPAKIFDSGSIALFRKAFTDVINILTNHQNHFYILPIYIIAIEDQKEHIKLLQKFFLNFLNTMLDKNFKTTDNFLRSYLTYEEIEKDMTPFFKSNLTFNDFRDETLSLRDKVECYIRNQPVMSSALQTKTEPEIFLLSVFGLVSQIMDILLITSITNITPFIRFKPTFHYLTIVMYSFIKEDFFKNMIKKTIIFYLFYAIVEKDLLLKIDFDEFVKIVQKNNFLQIIINEIEVTKIDIFETGISKVQQILEQQLNFLYGEIDKNKH